MRGGAALSKALEQQGGVFSRFYVNMIRAGEAGGALGDVLARLAEFMERSKDLKESVKSALIYPAILFFVAVFSVVILLAVVVPQFEPIFAQSGKALPLVTEVVLGAGALMRAWWWAMVLGAVALVYVIRADEVLRDADGNISELLCTYDPQTLGNIADAVGHGAALDYV